MITLQARPQAGFRVSGADVTLPLRTASTRSSAKLLGGNTFSHLLRICPRRSPPGRRNKKSVRVFRTQIFHSFVAKNLSPPAG